MDSNHTAAIVAEIRAELARQGVRHRDFAEAVDMTPSTLSRRLSGQSDMTLGEVERICRALGVTFPDLVARAERTESGAA